MKPRPTARERALRLHSEIEDARGRLHELHRRAGIADAVENLATPLAMPDLDVLVGSEAARLDEEIERKHQDRRFVSGLRRLYFGIADPELRRELIRCSRRFKEKLLEEAWAEVDEAREDLATAKKRSNWPLVAAAAGLGAVYLGFQIAGVGGAIGGAVVAFFWGKGLDAEASARQAASVASAERTLRSAQGELQTLADRGYIFSSFEAESGEPVADEAGWTRGRVPPGR